MENIKKKVEVWQIRRKYGYDDDGPVHREGTKEEMRKEWDEHYKVAFSRRLGLYKVTYELMDGEGDR